MNDEAAALHPDTWVPTPGDELVVVDVLQHEPGGNIDRARWVRRQFSELRKGDIFRAINSEGDYIDPQTGEADDECVAVALTDAFKSPDIDGIPLHRVNIGYAAEIDLYPSLAEYIKGGAQ